MVSLVPHRLLCLNQSIVRRMHLAKLWVIQGMCAVHAVQRGVSCATARKLIPGSVKLDRQKQGGRNWPWKGTTVGRGWRKQQHHLRDLWWLWQWKVLTVCLHSPYQNDVAYSHTRPYITRELSTVITNKRGIDPDGAPRKKNSWIGNSSIYRTQHCTCTQRCFTLGNIRLHKLAIPPLYYFIPWVIILASITASTGCPLPCGNQGKRIEEKSPSPPHMLWSRREGGQ